MKIIKGFENEEIEVSDFGEWVGKDYIDYKFEYENNQKVIKELFKENQKYKELFKENQKYKEAIDKAVDIAWRYGQTDGDHHQKWVTDQMVRALLGSDYEKFVKEHEKEDYTWDIGIAP